MKILIFTFSGTGNTYLTAEFIARALKSHGAEVVQHKLEGDFLNETRFDFGDADHILIGYPIHAFNPQQVLIKFIRSFPQSEGLRFSVFKTAGEPFFLNRCSSAQIIGILEKKGYEHMVETHFLMPYNIMLRYDDSLAKQMYLLMQKMAAGFADEVLSGRKVVIHSSFFSKAVSWLIRPVMWWGARFNGLLYSVRRKKCTMCLKCVRECPTKNISLKEGRIRFVGNCAMCMRCVQRCPAEAIDIGLLRFWAVRGGYDFEKLVRDDNVPTDFINADTRGYFRLFGKFFGVK